MARPDNRALLPSISCPTLVLVGRQDALTPRRSPRASRAPGSRSSPSVAICPAWSSPRRSIERCAAGSTPEPWGVTAPLAGTPQAVHCPAALCLRSRLAAAGDHRWPPDHRPAP
jgi:pimeloyl-ACP methyl ester carboxylesterase